MPLPKQEPDNIRLPAREKPGIFSQVVGAAADLLSGLSLPRRTGHELIVNILVNDLLPSAPYSMNEDQRAALRGANEDGKKVSSEALTRYGLKIISRLDKEATPELTKLAVTAAENGYKELAMYAMAAAYPKTYRIRERYEGNYVVVELSRIPGSPYPQELCGSEYQAVRSLTLMRARRKREDPPAIIKFPGAK